MKRVIPALGMAWLAGVAIARQPCGQDWSIAHHSPETLAPGSSACIKPFTFDGKTALYQSGGYAEDAGGVIVWEGGRWSPVVERKIDEGWIGSYDLAKFDDGDGPTLYGIGYPNKGPEGGLMVPRDGSWQLVLPVQVASALAVWDTGPSPGLYFSGYFRSIEGKDALYIGRWDGTNWHTVGGGMDYVPGKESPGVTALRVWDDGTGPALYAGGRFDTAGGVPAVSIAKWDGQQWSALGDPAGEYLIDNTQPRVYCMTDQSDPNAPGGRALYVGGNFQGTPGIASSSVLKWDGKEWTGLDGGLKTSIYPQYGDAFVYALEWFDDGDGMKLYAGGHITKTADGRPLNFIARWDGKTWEPVGGGMKGPVHALRSFDDGRGPTLWVGGESYWADGQGVWDGQWISEGGWKPTGAVARYSKSGWQRPNPDGAMDVHQVLDLLAREENGKQVVYAAGYFFGAGDDRQQSIARFDARTWGEVGDWTDLGPVKQDLAPGKVWSLATLPGDDGLYAAFSLPTGGHPPVKGIARFDGQRWSWAGDQFEDSAQKLCVHDDGGGPRLYVGTLGSDKSPGGVRRLEGQTWQRIATMKGSGQVLNLRSLRDPASPDSNALFAMGGFTSVNDVAAEKIARWDGQQWSALGQAQFTWPDATPSILAAAEFDTGDGPRVYVGGRFRFLNGQPCTLASWDGQEWRIVSKDPGWIRFMDVMDAGDGPALYVGGYFESVAGVPASGLIRLTASGQWENVDPAGQGFRYHREGGEFAGEVWDAALFNDPVSGPSLMVAGQFDTAGGVSSGNVAQLLLCPPPCPADCDGSGSLDLLDFACFQGAFAAGDAAADCDGSGSLDLFDFLCFVNAFNAGC